MPPGAEAQVQSEMAERALRLLSRHLCTSKRKVRNPCRGKASLPRGASRLLTAQRSFRSKLAPATETSACKSHKFCSALKLRVRKDFQARIDVSPTSPD